MSVQKNTSHKLLKSINQQKVLQLIFSDGPISRIELTKKTGLSQQTITNIVNRLLEDKIVSEGELLPLKAGSGRKRVSLFFNATHFYAIGIELATQYIRGCVYNFRNQPLHSAERPSNNYNKVEQLLELLHEVIDELLTHVPKHSNIKGIGIGVQGLVDSRQGILLSTSRLGSQRVHLKTMLEKKYNFPVFLSDDISLLAINENSKGSLIDSQNNITLKFDNGIGGAIISDKQIVPGSNFTAGMFAHYKGFAGQDSYTCKCGGIGCLKTLLSTSGFEATMGYTLEEFSQRIQSHDEAAIRLYNNMIETLALAISILVIFLNPDHVLLTGRVLTTLGDHMVSTLKEKVLYNIPKTNHDVRFIQLKHMPDVTLLATELVLKNEFEIPLESLGLQF